MKKLSILFMTIAAASFSSCNTDDNGNETGNAAGFTNSTVNLNADATTISIGFAAPAKASGSLEINQSAFNAVYGEDYTTTPSAANNVIIIPFDKGANGASFVFNRIRQATEGQSANVTFTLSKITGSGIGISDANKSAVVNFSEIPIVQNNTFPVVGGPTVPNQVYVDLSSGNQTAVPRTAWDFGFNSGAEYRVVINGSIKMAVKQLNTSDITLPAEIDNSVAVGEGGGSGILNGNTAYVDGPSGDLSTTAIAEVSANEALNKVYLVNLGHAIATELPGTGSVNPYGAARGWMKIRVLRDGNSYKLQYAPPASATFTEVTISKDAAYNFTFFSMATGAVVKAEPEKAKWDLNFTPFTNHVNFGSGLVSYAYQDFVVSNTRAGTRVYEVLNSAGTLFGNFQKANVDMSKLEAAGAVAAADQRVIGSNWRNGGGPMTLPSPKDDRFYVVKDSAGNIYKLRFTAMTNSAGERGNPAFEYVLLTE